ncbi:hypothetical protein AB1Y20_010410 [Prymnesium parvum]|uniref:PPM-type phosphatase domain-containing protein n=1 Tax=Prymnesium parvum TaxID=97485 RepID=A0AB34IS29_PRYPA
MSKATGKAPAGKSDDFRRRRLSLTDVDTSEFPETEPGLEKTPSKERARRMSMSPEMDQTPQQDTLPFPLKTVGTYSCHGVEPGSRQGQTNAKINQDRGCVVYPFAKNYALFCVFDGHGQHGDKVSHYAMSTIPSTLEEKLAKGVKEKDALKATFLKVDGDLKKDKTIDAELSGTTAVVLLYKFDETNKSVARLWAANCGDSRAVLHSNNGKVTDITVDQKPNSPAEEARIRKFGGYVSPPEEEWGGPARVWLDANMTLPGLAMARSIGDHLVDKVGVVADPEVTEFVIDTTKEDMIIMASDGVWEFIDSEQACKLLIKAQEANKNVEDATFQVTKLIETAAAKWRQEEGDYRDDITAICIKLRMLHECHFAS